MDKDSGWFEDPNGVEVGFYYFDALKLILKMREVLRLEELVKLILEVISTNDPRKVNIVAVCKFCFVFFCTEGR